MSSSIKRSDSGVRYRLLVLALAVGFFAGAHLVLEASARLAERGLGAHLWKGQDHLQLFQAHNYVGRGRSRLLISGPSEAREGLLPEELRRAVPDAKPYQHALSNGTLAEVLLLLDYIEKAYGESAIPAELLLGITPRFIGDIQTKGSPFQQGINLYSPHFRVEGQGHPPALVSRNVFAAAAARGALLGVQPDRYRRGLFALAGHVATVFSPSLAADRRLWVPIRPSKYLVGRAPEADTKNWLTTPGNFWDAVHAWDPEQSAERVKSELRMLLTFAARHDMKVYVVNLPELSFNRHLFQPGRYEAYLSIVKAALATTPFLDLRTFLADGEFFDDAHATWPGAIRLSQTVGEFVGAQRGHATGGRHDR